jgi:hypothetical protein
MLVAALTRLREAFVPAADNTANREQRKPK